MDIDDPGLFREYYHTLYDLTKAGDMATERADKIKGAMRGLHFADLAKHYRLIATDAINMLVPYDKEAYAQLADEVRAKGLRADWMRRAQRHVVSLYRPKRDAPIWNGLEPAPVFRGADSDDWFICIKEDAYDDKLRGLVSPDSEKCWIA